MWMMQCGQVQRWVECQVLSVWWMQQQRWHMRCGRLLACARGSGGRYMTFVTWQVLLA